MTASVQVIRKNQRALDEAQKRLEEACRSEVAAGYPDGVRSIPYPDGTSVLEVALKNCFGLGVPQRDFMTYAEILVKEDATIKDILRKVSEEANDLHGNADVVKALFESAGLRATSLIKRAITEGDWTPNAPSTVAKKGSSRPLIDTGHMRNSVTYIVRKKS